MNAHEIDIEIAKMTSNGDQVGLPADYVDLVAGATKRILHSDWPQFVIGATIHALAFASRAEGCPRTAQVLLLAARSLAVEVIERG